MAAGGSIVRLDPAFDALVPQNAEIEQVAGGFTFIEGPVWRAPGVLWFSDVIGNVVRQWSPDGRVVEILRPGGYDGNSLPAGGYLGPNGSTAGKNGTYVLCQHGNRRIVSFDRDMQMTVVVDNYEGKKLNAPNDLVYRSDGTLYFTDPPYGLPNGDDDPMKELPFNGVFKYRDGKLDVLVTDMSRPNGLAFSPDERTLYVANSDEGHRVWHRYDVNSDGTLGSGSVFANVSSEPDAGVPDGMKLDAMGNVFATGPGGVWVFTPDGKHIGTIKMPELPANVGWGDDGTSLYITACTSLYRVRTSTQGQRLVYGEW